MDQNATNEVQPNYSVRLNRFYKPVIIGGLSVIIVALLGGTVFFDNLKGLFQKSPNAQIPIVLSPLNGGVSPAPLPTIDPKVVCAKFKSLEHALANIKQACILDLSNQNLDSLPDNVKELTSLNEIILSKNKFAEFPEVLTDIPTLLAVDLANNQISSVPASISRLVNLQALDLKNNKISSSEQGKIETSFPSVEISF